MSKNVCPVGVLTNMTQNDNMYNILTTLYKSMQNKESQEPFEMHEIEKKSLLISDKMQNKNLQKKEKKSMHHAKIVTQ